MAVSSRPLRIHADPHERVSEFKVERGEKRLCRMGRQISNPFMSIQTRSFIRVECGETSYGGPITPRTLWVPPVFSFFPFRLIDDDLMMTTIPLVFEAFRSEGS